MRQKSRYSLIRWRLEAFSMRRWNVLYRDLELAKPGGFRHR